MVRLQAPPLQQLSKHNQINHHPTPLATTFNLPAAIRAQIVSLFTSRFIKKAGKLGKSPVRALAFVSFAYGKYSEFGHQAGLEGFSAAGRLLKAFFKGQYKALPWRSALGLLGALLYLASPIDIIPDFIPVLGFLDDAFIFSKILALASKDVADFRAWERANALVIVRP